LAVAVQEEMAARMAAMEVQEAMEVQAEIVEQPVATSPATAHQAMVS
jgi:hypothetical protein